MDRLWNSDLVSIWSDQAGWAALNQPAEIADLPLLRLRNRDRFSQHTFHGCSQHDATICAITETSEFHETASRPPGDCAPLAPEVAFVSGRSVSGRAPLTGALEEVTVGVHRQPDGGVSQALRDLFGMHALDERSLSLDKNNGGGASTAAGTMNGVRKCALR